MCANSRIPLDEVARHAHGEIFDVDAIVQERDPDCTDRLDVGNEYMLAELAGLLGEDFRTARDDPRYPLRLIPRRHGSFMNSSGTNLPKLNGGKGYNPAYMHPEAMAALGIDAGSLVTVTSPHDFIPSVLEADDTLRRDVIAMHHAFGGLTSEDDEVRDRGSNVGRLVPTDVDFDPITGLPRQGNIPVRVTRR